MRQNARVALGDVVRVRRVRAQPAISAALVPLSGTVNLSEAELRHVASSLRGQVIVSGDVVRAAGLGLSAREFQVLATNPASAVVLEAGTSLRIQARGSEHGAARDGHHL